MRSVANQHEPSALMAPLQPFVDLEQSPLGADGSLHVRKLVEHRVPVGDSAGELGYVGSTRPVHGFATGALGVHQDYV